MHPFTMDLNNGLRTKLSKEEKKLMKKQTKAKNVLLRHEGIKTVSHPSKNLVIANGGLGNGVSRHQLLVVLEKYGPVETLLMPPNKPYSFVTYRTTDEAARAYSSLSGQEIAYGECDQKVTLYLSFIEEVKVKDFVPPEFPPGLVIVEDFVSPEEETTMLESIDWTTEENSQKSLKHRRVKHFGYEFRYDNNNVDKDLPLPGGLPDFCTAMLDKCLLQGLIKHLPDQLTINQYEPGQGIPPHIDTHSAFEDGIISLSLGAEIVMDFKHPNGFTTSVMLPRRSLLVMSGESRYLWTHGITPRKFDVVQVSEKNTIGTICGNIEELTLNKRGTRTSFTFRKVRQGLCNCAFPSVCDSQQVLNKDDSPSVIDLDPTNLEKEFVHKVYEDIAGHFSSTRHTPWPRVVDFLMSLPKGSLVADVGCGNGKYLGINKDLYMIGCDRSKNLVDICGEKNFEACVCDALSVPFQSGSFDACISIAVIHHFATEERRLAAVGELTRLLRAGGTALIYVWAMEQEYKKNKSKYLKENKTDKEKQICKSTNVKKEDINITLPVHTNRTAFDSQDLLVPWHLKITSQAKDTVTSNPLECKENQKGASPVFHRYYHVFCEGELEALCNHLPNITTMQSYHDQGNWCVIVQKSHDLDDH
ncbi:alkylated DNA repair protein alkB homolog 8 isoform X2 [Bombina bombina]|uniref:alkylated DNA repair protein alkB homolog 8 isoform X2 n=1 Tax=Bombina bombina TaxID=8345 RepID=UPI00235AC17F|nr:alkylated DNA repair protein alkB homolog 8 isoform X2 [Bombina bombina]